MKRTLPRELALAAGTDAGNRRMSKHRRKPWSRDGFEGRCARIALSLPRTVYAFRGQRLPGPYPDG